MKRKTWLAGLTLFLLGWLLQVLLLYFAFPGGTTPQLLLVLVLAVGAMGRTDMAQTLGFLWGLGLDVFSVSLFGSQALLLVLAGYLTGRISRQLNVEKLAAQETLAVAGTLLYAGGLFLLEIVFRAGNAHTPSPAGFFLQLLLNLFLAPPLFWLTEKWLRRRES
jgi:rod shape-determining protein MreD